MDFSKVILPTFIALITHNLGIFNYNIKGFNEAKYYVQKTNIVIEHCTDKDITKSRDESPRGRVKEAEDEVEAERNSEEKTEPGQAEGQSVES